MPHFEKLLTDVGPDDPPAQAARRALKTRLRAVVFYLDEADSDAGPTVEAIHQLRIWTRRSAAALALFEPLIPSRKGRKLKKNLKRLRRTAGAARDLDIITAQLGEKLHGPLAEQLIQQRQSARKDLGKLVRRWSQSGKLKRNVKRLLKRLDGGRSHHGNGVAFGPWCRGQLAPLVEAFLKLATRGARQSDAGLHQWRLATKRLRYALELAVTALPKQAWSRFYELLSDLQDRIGRVCDALVERQRLNQWRREAAHRSERQELLLLLVDCRQRMSAGKKELARWWTASRRKTAQALCRQAGFVES